ADLVEVGHIGLDELRVGTEFGGQFRAVPGVHVADQHLGALGDEPAGQSGAETRCAAGDHGNLAGQFPCPFRHLVATSRSRVFTVVRKSSSSSLTAAGCSICGQCPASAITADRASGICAAMSAAHPGGNSLSPAPSTMSVGTPIR